jgi:signal recognition particle receptor subunit beta
MVSIATETDRTLYFDFLPLDLGQVAGMRTKFQLYTVPGQIYYNATRKLVLQGCDGVIFVADSAADKMPENLESLQNLRDNLAEMGLTIDDTSSPGFVPVILQYNKRDLPNALSVAELNAQMNPQNFPTYEACARDGKGVFATLKEASRLVIEKLNKEHAPGARGRRTGNALPAQPPPTAQTPTPAHNAVPAPPAAPTPPRPAPTLPQRLPGAGASYTPTAGSPVQRPAPPPPAPPRPPAPPPRSAYNPAASTPTTGIPMGEPASPREKHLQKAKPPALGARKPGPGPDLGATDPNLKKFQQSSGGGGGLKTVLIALIFVLIAAVLMVLLALFVPAVRAQLPMHLQGMLAGGSMEPTAPVVVPLPVPAPVVVAPVTPVAPDPAPVVAAPVTPAPAPLPVDPAPVTMTPTPVPAPEAIAPVNPVAPAPETPSVK